MASVFGRRVVGFTVAKIIDKNLKRLNLASHMNILWVTEDLLTLFFLR